MGDPTMDANMKWQRVLDDVLRFPARINQYRTDLESTKTFAQAIAPQFTQAGENLSQPNIDSLDALESAAGVPELMSILRTLLIGAMKAKGKNSLTYLDVRFLYADPQGVPKAFIVSAIINGSPVSCTVPTAQNLGLVPP